MKVKDILKDTTVLIAGHIDEENDYEKLSLIIDNNKDVINKFKSVVCIFNRSEKFLDNQVEDIAKLLKDGYNNCTVLIDWVNRGHQIGHVDLDRKGFSFIKNNYDSKYILKLSGDILISDPFLEIDIDEDVDFLYQPSINIPDALKYGDSYFEEFNKSLDFNDGLCPQTIFYILSTKVDFPYEDSLKVDNKYDKWVGLGYKGTNQNLVLAAEHSLNKCIIRNNFKRKMMVSEKDFKSILNYMGTHNNNDSTLKNIYITKIGLCHWQHKLNKVVNW
tara:strand:- start:2890 stop:3714 length:825 start_codon:yes stop_codon:yes gene_type:complete